MCGRVKSIGKSQVGLQNDCELMMNLSSSSSELQDYIRLSLCITGELKPQAPGVHSWETTYLI